MLLVGRWGRIHSKSKNARHFTAVLVVTDELNSEYFQVPANSTGRNPTVVVLTCLDYRGCSYNLKGVVRSLRVLRTVCSLTPITGGLDHLIAHRGKGSSCIPL
jgi:hypothetical protein